MGIEGRMQRGEKIGNTSMEGFNRRLHRPMLFAVNRSEDTGEPLC